MQPELTGPEPYAVTTSPFAVAREVAVVAAGARVGGRLPWSDAAAIADAESRAMLTFAVAGALVIHLGILFVAWLAPVPADLTLQDHGLYAATLAEVPEEWPEPELALVRLEVQPEVVEPEPEIQPMEEPPQPEPPRDVPRVKRAKPMDPGPAPKTAQAPPTDSITAVSIVSSLDAAISAQPAPGGRGGFGIGRGVAAMAAGAEVTRTPEPAVDTKALLRGYIRKVSTALRRDFTYPGAAARRRIEGTVILELTIDANGDVVGRRVAKSSGHEVLDAAALDAAQKVDRVPAPPKALSWTRRAIRVPFAYSLRG